MNVVVELELLAHRIRLIEAAGVGGGDLIAANNLSDVANVATARTNLGLAVGTDVQARDPDLDALAAIVGTQGDLAVYGASGWEALAKSATATDVLTAGATQPQWDAAPAGGGTGTGIEGGVADTVYGGTTAIDGGTA